MTNDFNAVYSSMVAGGKPYKTYIKTILGRVYITALNMITGTPVPEGIILKGDPRKKEANAMFDVWSEQEEYYFRKYNQRHFEQGVLIEYTRDETPRERTMEEFSDEELKTLINKPWLAFQATLNKTTSVATLFRFENLARDMDKSEKVMRAIASRLSEVQEAAMPTMPKVVEEEI